MSCKKPVKTSQRSSEDIKDPLGHRSEKDLDNMLETEDVQKIRAAIEDCRADEVLEEYISCIQTKYEQALEQASSKLRETTESYDGPERLRDAITKARNKCVDSTVIKHYEKELEIVEIVRQSSNVIERLRQSSRLEDNSWDRKKVWKLQIADGMQSVPSKGKLLSTIDDGSKIDLYTHVDESGRQKWKIIQNGDWVNIVSCKDASDGKIYLSATDNGLKVDLQTHEDGSELQRWRLEKVRHTRYYHIVLSGGVPFAEGRKLYLASTPNGSRVSLCWHDSGSGRQRWYIDDADELAALFTRIECSVAQTSGQTQ